MESDPRRGQALLMMTLSLVALFGLLGLVVDVGWAHFRQLAAQSAAEAAALAAIEAAAAGSSVACGSHGIACGTETCIGTVPRPPSDNLQHGCLYAVVNGFPGTAPTGVEMSAGSGPAAPTAPHVGVRYWVTARAWQRLPQLFSAVLGHRTMTVAARATAGLFIDGESACLYVLDPAARSAFAASGGAIVTATGCDLYVASRDSEAMGVSGGARVSADAIQVVGWYRQTGAGSSISPEPVKASVAEEDPFAQLPAPDMGGCDHDGWHISGEAAATLEPGVYCGGITIGSDAAVTMKPGTYILNGGGMTVSGQATLSGTGVTIFNTGQGSSPAGVKFTGGGEIHLSAPDAGTYKGILFYQDRAMRDQPESDFAGGSAMHLNGSVYIPNAGIRFAGGSDADFTALVVRTVSFTGNSQFKPDPSGAHTGLARRTVALIE